jgi:hypothetical protein
MMGLDKGRQIFFDKPTNVRTDYGLYSAWNPELELV